MTRGRKGSGVEPREKSIRVSFMWKGERCRETLDRAPTPPNLKWAARVAAEVKDKIERGTFVYSEYFPDSPRAKAGPAKVVTIADRGRLFLATCGRLSSATRSQYANALKFWCSKLGPERDIATVRHGDLAAAIGSHKWPSAKLCNNYLIPLRGLFELSVTDKVIQENPMDGIVNTRHQRAEPDPFTLDEVEAILADMRSHYHDQVVNYFEFMFFSGLRPEEAIALKWTDVSMSQWGWSVRVSRAKSFRGEVKATKTHRGRDVELLERAEGALDRQRAFTLMKALKTHEPDYGWVFENPVTGRPWHDERSQRDHYFRPTLLRIKVRYRNAYNTRHTYATLALMSGANPSYIARQLGHRNAKMVFEVYAKWIDRADRGAEKGRIDAAIREFVPNLSLGTQNAGRRDWTRTNPTGDSRGKQGSGSE